MTKPIVRVGYLGGDGTPRILEFELDPENPRIPEIADDGDNRHPIVILRHKPRPTDPAAQDNP
jgi:hypothetical protein